MRNAAGFILVHFAETGPQFLLLRNARHGTWSFPKGHLDPGESDLEGARRELAEETGITAIRRFPDFEAALQYTIPAGRRADYPTAYEKRVTLFLAEAPTAHWTRSPEHDEGGWFPPDAVAARLSHPDLKRAFTEAQHFLAEMPSMRHHEPQHKNRGSSMSQDAVKKLIRDIPDFPKPGIVFKDITPVLRDGPAFRHTIGWMADLAQTLKADLIAGPESRGFIFGAAVAQHLQKGFVPIRKPGKLPWKTRSVSYALEYGTDTIEIHEDAVAPGQRVLLVDDLLATGGTMAACCELVESLGGVVAGCLFMVELQFLAGRERLAGRELHSLVTYS